MVISVKKEYAIVVLTMILVCFSVFLFQNDSYGFSRWHHGDLSSQGMAISKNLSSYHNFLMFSSAKKKHNNISYEPYNIYPIFPFLIIRLSSFVCSDQLDCEIYSARQIMNIFFLISLLLSYSILFKITGRRMVSLAATLLAFSSCYISYYNDMVFNDMPSLTGFLLVMYGIVKYELEDNKRFVFGSTIFALSMGWQVYSLLFIWLIVGIVRRMISFRSLKEINYKKLIPILPSFICLIAILYGCLIIFFQLSNESRMTKTPIFETASIENMKTDVMHHQYTFHETVTEQFIRLSNSIIPYFISGGTISSVLFSVIIFTLFLLFPSVLVNQNRKLLFILGFSGFIWGVGMKNFTMQRDFQAIYYIGIPLVVYLSLLYRIPNKYVQMILPLCLILFLSTNFYLNQQKNATSKKLNQYTDDFQNIRTYLTGNNVVCFFGRKSKNNSNNFTSFAEGFYAVDYYLSGNYYAVNKSSCRYILSTIHLNNKKNLTPENKKVYLFLR